MQRYESCENICNSLPSCVLICLEIKEEVIRAKKEEELGRQRPHLKELQIPHKVTEIIPCRLLRNFEPRTELIYCIASLPQPQNGGCIGGPEAKSGRSVK